MSFLDQLIHLFNFAAPALFLAVCLPAAARLVMGRRQGCPAWWLQMSLNAVVGLTTLGLCLWWLGRDGRMSAYAALVLSMATSQWLLVKGWRR